MRNLNGREMKVLVLLSVVIPVGILAGLRLTGTWHGPIVISETTTLETISWQYQIPTPYNQISLDRHLSSHSTSAESSAVFDLQLDDYVPSVPPDIPWATVRMAIGINSTAGPKGSIESVGLNFSVAGSVSQVLWDITHHFVLYNLSVAEQQNGYANHSALLRLVALNNPVGVSSRTLALWEFLSPNNQVQRLQASFEVTYHNGTAYKRVVQPLELTISGG